MKIPAVILLFVFAGSVIAQTATETYNKGLEAFNKKQFAKADSLFSKSLSMDSDAFAYFNRGAARRMLGDPKGYCEDVRFAAALDDTLGHGKFLRYCGTTQKLFLDSLGQPLDSAHCSRIKVIYKTNFPSADLIVLYDRSGKFREALWPHAGTDVTDNRSPGFPGGEVELKRFIRNHLVYPTKAREAGISGRVLLSFTVNQRGRFNDIRVVESVSPELDQEAIRLLQSMPRWEPARSMGQPVKALYTLPVTYKIL